MSKLLSYRGYKGSVGYDLDEGILYGKVEFIRDLINYEAKDLEGLGVAFKEAVDDYLESCEELGVEPNKSLSGTFQIRIGEELHEYAAIRAMEIGKSLNEWIKQLVELDRCGKRELHTHTHMHNYSHTTQQRLVVVERSAVTSDIWQPDSQKFLKQIARH